MSLVIAITNVCMYNTNDYKTHLKKDKRSVKRNPYADVYIL